MTDQTMTPEQALTRAQTLVGKLRGKHVAGSLSLDEQMELGLCWQTLRAALSRPALQQKPALEWSKTLLDGKRVTYKQAEKAVAELGDGWRLPTRQELESLLDLSRHDPAIDVEKYPDTESCAYWTSTPCAWVPTVAWWAVDFGHGAVGGNPRGCDACVRAVRASYRGDDR